MSYPIHSVFLTPADCMARFLEVWSAADPAVQGHMQAILQHTAECVPAASRSYWMLSAVVLPCAKDLARTGRLETAHKLAEFTGGLDLDGSGMPFRDTEQGKNTLATIKEVLDAYRIPATPQPSEEPAIEQAPPAAAGTVEASA